jgi:hypothetical protein
MKFFLSKTLAALKFIETWLNSVISDACGIIERVIHVAIRVALFIILYKVAVSDFLDQILNLVDK